MSSINHPMPAVGLKIRCSAECKAYMGSKVPSVRIVHDEITGVWQVQPAREKRGLIVFLIPPFYDDMQGIEITRVQNNVAFATEF